MARSVCSFAGCDEQVHGRGFCGGHYRQYRLGGWDRSKVRELRSKAAGRPNCKFPECGRVTAGRGYCSAHYANLRNNNWDETALKPIFGLGPRTVVCTFEGCGRRHVALGLCETHYKQHHSTGVLREIRTQVFYREGDTCLVRSCDTRPRARGFCSKHYKAVSDYGLTPERFVEMMEDPKCGICSEYPEGRNLHIDHDHSCCSGVTSCGKCVRGILCGQCNAAIGMMKESIPTLISAIKYLESR